MFETFTCKKQRSLFLTKKLFFPRTREKCIVLILNKRIEIPNGEFFAKSISTIEIKNRIKEIASFFGIKIGRKRIHIDNQKRHCKSVHWFFSKSVNTRFIDKTKTLAESHSTIFFVWDIRIFVSHNKTVLPAHLRKMRCSHSPSSTIFSSFGSKGVALPDWFGASDSARSLPVAQNGWAAIFSRAPLVPRVDVTAPTRWHRLTHLRCRLTIAVNRLEATFRRLYQPIRKGSRYHTLLSPKRRGLRRRARVQPA